MPTPGSRWSRPQAQEVDACSCTCKIRTEDFLDVATSARLSVVVPTCFHVPVRAIGYYCYGHFCYESGLTGATIGSYARVSMLPDYYVAGSILHTCITMYVGRRRSARSYCVRAHAPGLEQTDDYHRCRCKLCVNWMPEYSDSIGFIGNTGTL